MLACGPGNSCCGKCAGLAGALDLSKEAPRTFAVLKAYVDQKVSTREPFYISPEVNSGQVQFSGLGFFQALVGAVTALAPTVASVAGTAASIKAMKGGKASANDADRIAAEIAPLVQQKLAAQGINLPDSIARQATAAGILDSFGTENRPFVMAGIGLVGVLLLTKILRR